MLPDHDLLVELLAEVDWTRRGACDKKLDKIEVALANHRHSATVNHDDRV